MLQFLLRRVLGLVFVIISVTFITFLMGYIAPGLDPIKAILGARFTPEQYITERHLYGLDLPWYQQYGNFLLNLARGNFGLSYHLPGRNVIDILAPGIQVSVLLGMSAFVISILIGIPAGILASLRRGTWTDSFIMGIMLFLYAVPAFVVIPLYQVLMDVFVQKGIPNLPVIGWDQGPTYKIMPILILAFTSMGYYARLTRTVMLDVLGQDYVRTARSKGLSERSVIYLHALRNAVLPLLSVIGPSLAFLVSGAFVIEFLFNIPGVGFAGVAAVANRDWPVLQATVVILATAVVVMNLITDVLYGVVDPRIRVS
jgi:ABC-type dipeptide/oligopeptide/nickel transport system permease component